MSLDFSLSRDDLCARLGGGLPAGSLVAIKGPRGAGKSILCQRIAAGLAANGHSVAYVSTELTTKAFLEQMASLDYGIRGEMLMEQCVFIPAHPLIGARAPKHQLLERIAHAKLLYTKDIVMFDAFSKFLSDHQRAVGDDYAATEQVEAILHLFKRITSAGKTIVLTLENDQVPGPIEGLFCESADVYIELEGEVIGNSTTRRIVVKRMSRAPSRYSEVIGFRVEPGVGVVIEIRSVV